MNGGQMSNELREKATALLSAILEQEGKLEEIQNMSKGQYRNYLKDQGFTNEEIKLLSQDYGMRAGVQRFPWWLY